MGAVLVGVALAGCASAEAPPDPVPSEAVTAPPPTGSATPTPPTPTPTTPEPVAAPERPAAMDQSDETGAVAAAEYFLALSQYTVHSGALDRWEQVATQDCRYCAYVTQTAQDAQDRGVRIIGGDLTVRTAELTAADSALGVYAVSVAYEASPLVEVSPDGIESTVSPAGAGVLTVEVVLTTDGWRLLGVVSQEPS